MGVGFKSQGLESGIIILCALCYKAWKERKRRLKGRPPISGGTTAATADPESSDVMCARYSKYARLHVPLCAADLCYENPTLKLYDNVKMEEAVGCIAANKARSALLFNYLGGLVGLLDTLSVVRYILVPHTASNTVRSVIRHCTIASPTTKADDIISHMLNGVRHIAVTKQIGVELISQKTVVQSIVNSNSTDVWDMSVKDLKLGSQPRIHSCCVDDCARQAFQVMSAFDITSVPIVDHNTHVCGVISATDIFCAVNAAHLLEGAVQDFLLHSRKLAGRTRAVSHVVKCQYNETLSAVVRRMIDEDVHHVYVVQETSVVGVVSYMDVLGVLTS